MIFKEGIGKKKDDIILFVHGAWHGGWCWERYFMDDFAQKGYDTYALTLRKHETAGQIKGVNMLSTKNYIEDLKKAIKELPEEPIIVAHSMGGYILQKYLQHHSCKKAILMASVPPTGVLRTTLSILKRSYALPALLSFNMFGIVNSLAKTKWAFFSENASEEDINYCNNHLCGESYLVFVEMMMPNIKINFHTKIPLLVIAAEHDHIFTVKENKITAQKYNADFILMEDMAHDMMLDIKHKEAAEKILDWLETK